MSRIAVPDEIRRVAARINDSGYKVVLVGGCVRDHLLARQAKDWDLATSATPDQVAVLFPGTRATTRFGTALVPGGPGGEIVEITTFRSDGAYADFRRPDSVSFTGDVETDLARRDFTMNAIAYDPIADTFIDPYHGLDDLRAGVIRAVRDPQERFNEDALRMLRAARFASQLGFTIAPETAAAIIAKASLGHHLAAERVGMELTKILLSDMPSTGIAAMADLGLLAVLVPELVPNIDHGLATLRGVERAEISVAGRVVALGHHVGTDAASSARTLFALVEGRALGTGLASEVRRLATALGIEAPDATSDPDLWRRYRAYGAAEVGLAMTIRAACEAAGGQLQPAVAQLAPRLAELYARGLPAEVTDLPIGGDDLIAAGVRPGPAMGSLLRDLLEAVTDGRLANERAALLDEALRRTRSG